MPKRPPTFFRLLTLLCVVFTASHAIAAIKIACVGDSITASSTRYPTYLAQNLGTAYEVSNFGVAGTTMLKATSTSYWNTTNFTASGNYLPDIVIIMLGTNDSKVFNWGPYGANYQSDYIDMILHYQGLASRPSVYIMTSPPNFTDGTDYQPTVIANQIVPTVRGLSTTTGSELIDIFTTFTGHPELFSDGTHPTTEGSQMIAAIVTSVIQTTRSAPRTSGTFEAESQAVSGCNLDISTINSEAGYSGGKGVQYNGTAGGDYVTLRAGNVAAGTYNVVVGYKKYTSRGIVQVAAGTAGGTLTNVGGALDEYSAASTYTSSNLGNWTATTTGDQDFRFQITGHNASSSGYSTTIDYIKLTPVPTYTITASAGSGGTITPSGSVPVAQGGSQTYTIAANAGNTISAVTVDGTNVGAVTNYTFSNVQANHTISAAFASSGNTTSVTSTDGFYNRALGSTQTGSFSVDLDASVSLSPSNTSVSLCQGNATAYSGLACMVRFNSTGTIDARNGGAFAAVTAMPFAANTTYHVRLDVNVATHTYSAYVTAPGGSPVTIASNYAFRTEQASVTSLDTFDVDVNATPGGSATFGPTTVSGTADTNIAPSGTGYGWKANTSSTANTNRSALAGVNDNNLTADVDLDSAGDAVGGWEGAGVTWTTAKTISSAKVINGTVTTGGDGFLTANLKLQFSTDGSTWTDSGWTVSPAYPYSSAASGQTYTFSGTITTGVLGARVVGQVRTVDTSYHWIVKEVQLLGH